MVELTSPLPSRTLGELYVTALGMGVMNVVHAYGPPTDRNQAVWLARHAVARGVRFFRCSRRRSDSRGRCDAFRRARNAHHRHHRWRKES
jgi:hypothetical protein